MTANNETEELEVRLSASQASAAEDATEKTAESPAGESKPDRAKPSRTRTPRTKPAKVKAKAKADAKDGEKADAQTDVKLEAEAEPKAKSPRGRRKAAKPAVSKDTSKDTAKDAADAVSADAVSAEAKNAQPQPSADSVPAAPAESAPKPIASEASAAPEAGATSEAAALPLASAAASVPAVSRETSESASSEAASTEKNPPVSRENERSPRQGDAPRAEKPYQQSAKSARTPLSSRKDSQARNSSSKKGAQPVSQKHHRMHRQHVSQSSREVVPSVTQEDFAKLKVAELREKAAELEIDVSGLKKAELVQAVFDASVKAEGFIEVEGILDILADGYGFLRTQGYLPSETDCYVGLSLIRRNGLRKGDWIVGQTRPPRDNEKYAALRLIASVNGTPVEEGVKRIRFGDLTPVYPDECLVMEHGKNTITSRVIDLVSPIGKGQRGLIVSPPKAGKTTILKDIAASISANNPEVHLMCLLVDERPEEVTDMERSIKGEVISSTFDMPTENHIAVAELVIERAKRLVECGKDVVVLLDSLTRLARAYNLAQPASGRILSGGVDSTALYPPKRFLGAARNIEGGGSLTILASALVDTGSKMDEVIFEEFKGTGNMELKLDRNLANRRIFPAIDPIASGTRKEELLLNSQEAPLIWAVRDILANMNSTERAVDMLIKSLKQTETNQEFLMRTAKKAQQYGAEGNPEL